MESMGVFSALAMLPSGRRSAAAPPFIQQSQDEKNHPLSFNLLDRLSYEILDLRVSFTL